MQDSVRKKPTLLERDCTAPGGEQQVHLKLVLSDSLDARGHLADDRDRSRGKNVSARFHASSGKFHFMCFPQKAMKVL